MSALIWIADDDHTIRWVLQKALQGEGYRVTGFASADQVAHALREGDIPDLLLTDIRMPGAMNGLDLLEHFHAVHAHTPVIVMTAHGNIENAVSTFTQGAFDYLVKPFDLDVAMDWVRRALNKTPNQSSPPNSPKGLATTAVATSLLLQSTSPRMQAIYRTIGKIARIRSHVLITGESGTGKELIARALHTNGEGGGAAPWVEINCAAVPRELLESEMFGHEKGAFTGASTQHIGHFERAHGGTLFLDEIGDMPLDLQARLLRVLATGQFYRVGGKQLIRVSTRIISATHQNLEQAVAQKTFRQDLFYRLKVIHIHLPPLRERPEDILPLAEHFLAQQEGARKYFDDSARALLQSHRFSGNVRELENLCHWAQVMVAGDTIHAEDLIPMIAQQHSNLAATQEVHSAQVSASASNDFASSPIPSDSSENWTKTLKKSVREKLRGHQTPLYPTLMEQFESAILEETLHHTHGKKQKAAELIGVNRNTLAKWFAHSTPQKPE